MSARYIATRILKQVLEEKVILPLAIKQELARQGTGDSALIRELCYGALRWGPELEWLLAQLLEKPIKQKHSELKYLLWLGLYQLKHMDIAPHAVLQETVQTCLDLHKAWARGLVNAILRRFQRDSARLSRSLAQDQAASSAHPAWLIDRIRRDWPAEWAAILTENNRRPPMFLRVNRQKNARADYLKRLSAHNIGAQPAALSPEALLLDRPCPVEQLPGFAAGRVSVQDLAAQLAVDLLDIRPGHRVLDCCAAPGGKGAHILERRPDLAAILLIEQEPARAARLQATLRRLDLAAEVKICDARLTAKWRDKSGYDRILLDAPCSATGVIRRQPDIKFLRTEADIDQLSRLQFELLAALWPALKKNGRLLYATCSILRQENAALIQRFQAAHADCVIHPLPADWGRDTGYGRQIMTGEHNMDGFFYASLGKNQP